MRKQEDRPNEELARFLTDEDDSQGKFAAYAASLAALRALRETPPRNESRAAAAQKAFLLKARLLPRPVSAAAIPRHKGWMYKNRKEFSPMRTLARSLLIVALALGGTGATAFAAQSSMPDDALYPVKLLTEDIRLSLTNDPAATFNYLLNLAEERSREVTGLANQGLPVPNEVTFRLQEHLQQALKQAGQMDEPAMIQAMQQIQTMAQFQLQVMEQTQAQTQTQEGGALDKAQQTMFEMQTAAQGALENPAIFQNQQGIGRPEDAPDRPEILPLQGNSDGGKGQGSGQGSGGQGGKDGSGEGECLPEEEGCDPLLLGTPMPDGSYYYPYLRDRGYGRYW
ncbi:MAG: DUF5667 domain-containing protein [Anaerolineales bacterium]|nr:DUF5667 domain-containing protein [Anaerolineales bacterium]